MHKKAARSHPDARNAVGEGTVRWLLLGFSVSIACCVLLFMAHRIPEGNLTRSRLIGIRHRIFLFIGEQHRLPGSLAALPKLGHFDNSIVDAWGRSIVYTSDTNGVVSLVSFGSDGVPGGTGDAEDIEDSFPTKSPEGEWLSSYSHPAKGHGRRVEKGGKP
jgi:hypothetical protein